MNKILCVGNAVVDVIVKNGPDRTPDGMTQFSESINMYLGGDAVNEAVSLKAMGNDVKLYTVIGEDSLGDAFLGMIKKAGIETDGIILDKEHGTTATVVTVGADGEHGCMTLKNGAAGNMCYNPRQFDLDFSGAKLLSVASLFWSRGQREDDLKELFHTAKEAGLLTAADMVLDQSQMTLDDIGRHSRILIILFPVIMRHHTLPEKILRRKLQMSFIEEASLQWFSSWARKAFFASQGGRTFRVESIADQVVDTLGGGDNFVAGFLTGIMDGLELEEALYFGSAAAAIAISEYGANGAIKSKEQVQAYLDSHRK